MYVHPFPSWCPTGTYFLAEDESTGAPLGVVRGIRRIGPTVEMAWYCEPDKAVIWRVQKLGLRLSEIQPGKIPKVGRCLGFYRGIGAWSDSHDHVDIELELDNVEMVMPDDSYEIVVPSYDAGNSAVVDFTSIGLCIVQSPNSYRSKPFCRILLTGPVSGTFSREDFHKVGVVHFASRRSDMEPPPVSRNPVGVTPLGKVR